MSDIWEYSEAAQEVTNLNHSSLSPPPIPPPLLKASYLC